MADLLMNLILHFMVRLLFVAFMLTIGLWGGLQVSGSDMNVIELTRDTVQSFQNVAEVLDGRGL